MCERAVSQAGFYNAPGRDQPDRELQNRTEDDV